MSSAIGYVVYGIDLMGLDDNEDLGKTLADDIEVLKAEGIVQTRYSGNGADPCFIGTLVATLSEGNNFEFECLKPRPNLDDKQVFRVVLGRVRELEEISVDIKEYLLDLKPSLFLTWGSS